MNSRLWEAQDALYALLGAQTWPDRNVQISLGRPSMLETDAVWVGGEVDTWNAEYRVSGLAAKDEDFVLRVYVYAVKLGGYADARSRVQTLGEVVEDAIASDYTLDGSVMLATINRGGLAEAIMDDGRRRQCLLTMYVQCRAFVT